MKKIVVLFTAVILALSFAGCGPARPGGGDNVQINPDEDAANKAKVPVTLYFEYGDELLLAGEPRVVEAPVNGRLETAVIKALAGGPSTGSQSLKPLLPSTLRVVNVSEEGEYLFVTLSADFIGKMPALSREKRQLAVYSIVNTLIEMGGYSRVHLRVDKDGTGIGQSITRSEAGFDGGDTALEPLGFYSPIVLNPKNTVAQFLQNYADKDWEKVYEMIAFRDITGDEKPSEDDFLSEVVSYNSGVEEYNVLDYYTSGDGSTAAVMIDFDAKNKDGEMSSFKNMPLKLFRENNVWRISYASFQKVFKFNQ